MPGNPESTKLTWVFGSLPNFVDDEEKSLDYPIGFVRWTEQRNFLSILDLMSTKKISPSKFITNRYDIDNVAEKYGQILKSQDSLGILIDYGFTIEKIAIISGIYILLSLVLLFSIRKKLSPVNVHK